jgi:hypothetical protein
MTLFLPGMEESFGSTAVVCSSTARSWCDPAQHCEVVGIDFGCNSVHYYMARCGQHGKLRFSELFGWLERLPSGTLVACESAHLGVAQTELSLAQPFTAEQLLDLYKRLRSRGITLKLAPHAHTGKRMRLWVAHHFREIISSADKSDAADAIALSIYVDKCNEIALANPCRSFANAARREFGRKVRQLSNSILNAERTDEYGGNFYPLVVELAREVWRRGYGRDLKFALSIASTLAWEKEGNLQIFTHRGQIPGRWFWMRNVLCMSAWHHRGGIARSNLMWHVFRPYLASHAMKVFHVNVKSGSKYKEFAVYSDREKAARTSAMKSYRELILRYRDSCIAKAMEMGAQQLELTNKPQEVSCGR